MNSGTLYIWSAVNKLSYVNSVSDIQQAYIFEYFSIEIIWVFVYQSASDTRILYLH